MSDQPKKILVIKHGSLGDIFLMLGALKDLAEIAGKKVDVLTMSPYVKLFKRSPDVDQVHIDNRKSRFSLRYLYGLWRIFRSPKYDLIVDFQNSTRTVFYRRTIGRGLRWCQMGVIAPDNFVTSEIESPVIGKFVAQLTECGVSTRNLLAGDLSWLCEASSAQVKVASSKRSVVLLPGASARHTHKIWPRYAALAEKLLDQGVDVFIVPGPEDLELCRTMPGEILLDGDRWLDFFQLAGVLKEAKFVVGNDSGPTHLAASLNCKGLALFSSRTAEYAPNMRRRRMDTRTADELSDIGVEEVAEKVMAAI